MSRTVVFVDAGFIEVEGRRMLKSSSRVGPSPSIDAKGVIGWARQYVSGRFPTEPEAFLRGYWYTAAFDPSDPRFEKQRQFHTALETVPGLRLRLGRLVEREPNWHAAVKAALAKCGVDIAEFEKYYEFRRTLSQKGVDARIVLDIVRFAERRVYDVGILLAGDRDLAEAVQVAQDAGTRFLVAHPKSSSIALELKNLADEVIPLEIHELEKMFRKRKASDVDVASAVTTD